MLSSELHVDSLIAPSQHSFPRGRILSFTVLQMRKPRRVTAGVGLWFRPKQCASRGLRLHTFNAPAWLDTEDTRLCKPATTKQLHWHSQFGFMHSCLFSGVLSGALFAFSFFFFFFFPFLFLTLNNLNLANFKVRDSSSCSNLIVEHVE